jgi:hypothetical protein
MELGNRLLALKQTMKTAKDDARYTVAEKLREFGYLNFADFCVATPHDNHVAEIETLLASAAH